MELQELTKEIKHQFMTYRNGIVSDTLRKAGMNYNIIFGLQLPQLSAISRSVMEKVSAEEGITALTLAESLWNDKGVRESRLLSSYLFPPEEIPREKALELANDLITREEADILSFRLLRRLPFAADLAEELLRSANPLTAYCGEALQRNLN